MSDAQFAPSKSGGSRVQAGSEPWLAGWVAALTINEYEGRLRDDMREVDPKTKHSTLSPKP